MVRRERGPLLAGKRGNFVSQQTVSYDLETLNRKNKMSQDTHVKKREIHEISEDPIIAENLSKNEPETNKHAKVDLNERCDSDGNKPAWLLALTDKIKSDDRIGYPKNQPPIPELNHGWLMEANKEVLHALIKPEFSKNIQFQLHAKLL